MINVEINESFFVTLLIIFPLFQHIIEPGSMLRNWKEKVFHINHQCLALEKNLNYMLEAEKHSWFISKGIYQIAEH